MKRNSTTLFLVSPGATTPVPWVDNAPDLSGFTEPTLSVLQGVWEDFLKSGEELEIISSPEPIIEPPTPNWNAFNIFMLSDATFNNYCNAVFEVNKNLNSALLNAYSLVAANGVSAFIDIWEAWCSVAQITTEHRDIFANTAEGLNLPSDFVAAIRGQQ